MPHPPPAVGREADPNREVASAYEAGGFTAVLEVARRHQMRLQHEWVDLTRDLNLTYVTASERTAPPSPLEIQLNELRREMRDWDHVAKRAEEHAANEAHGWTILPDGTPLKTLPDGRIISTSSSVRQDERAACHHRSAFTPRRVRPLARRRGAGRPRAQATRSSARSGDGPSDDDGESPPPPELQLERHPVYGRCSANLLRVLGTVR